MASLLDWMRRGAPDAEFPELTDAPTSAALPATPEPEVPAAPRSGIMSVQAAPEPAPRPLTAWRPPSPGQRAEAGPIIPDRLAETPTAETSGPAPTFRQSTARKEPKWIEVPGKGWLQFPGEMEDEQIGIAIRKNFPDLQQGVGSQIANAASRGVTGTLATGLRGAGTLSQIPALNSNRDAVTSEAYAAATPEERQVMRRRVDADMAMPQAQRMALHAEFSDIDEGLAPRSRQRIDLRGNPLTRAGDWVERQGNAAARLDPEQADRWYNQVAQGVGSTVALLGTSVIGIPGGAAAMRLSMWVSAGATGAGEAADRALRAGADEASVIRAAYSGLVPGGLDALSIDNMLRPIHANPGTRAVLYAIAKKALQQAGVEGTTEAVQQVMQNAIARGIYQPNQPLTEDVVENFLVGAAVGGLFGAGMAARPGGREPPPPVPGQPGASIPIPPGPPTAPQAPQGAAPAAPPLAPAPAPQGAPAAPPAQPAAPAQAAAPLPPPAAPAAVPNIPAPSSGTVPGSSTIRPPTPAEQAATELRDVLADPRPAAEIAAAQAAEREQQLAAAAAERDLVVDQQVRLTFPDGADEGTVRRVYWSEDGEPSVTITRPITNARGQPDELRVYDGPIAGLGGVERVQGDGTVRSPRVVQSAQDVAQAAQQVRQPTPGQAEAGNYRMGHIKLHGMDIAIETPQGGTRTAADGSWEVRDFPAHYGYVKAGKGADGDKVDVYVGPSPESQRVFAIDQIDPGSRMFDEHKIMLGFPDEAAALDAYERAFSDGSGQSRIGAVTTMSVRQLQSWLANEDTRQPLTYENPRPEANYGTPAAPSVVPIAQAIAKEIAGGRVFKTIVQARQFVRDLLGGKPIPAESLKVIDEAIELAYVLRARDIVAQGGEDRAGIYRELTRLYLEQPNLTQTTSTSKKTQAFSTPLPLAYIASRLAQVGRDKTVFEPTAGNGALLIEADPKNVDANEIQNSRALALEAQGFSVTSADATTATWEQGTRDVVIMNPPFGKMPDGGRADMGDGYVTNQIDHVIALRALEAMRPDGSAVMLIGSVNPLNEAGRAEAYRGRAKTEFFLRLREQFNVVDIFTVDGDLYSRQGAAWPVDVVVIRGRGQSARALPSVDVPRVYSSWADLGVLLDADYPAAPANLGTPEKPAAGSRDDGGGAAGSAEQGGLPAPDREPAGARAGGRGRPGRGGGTPGQEAGGSRPDRGDAAGAPGGQGGPTAVPEPAPAASDQQRPEPGQARPDQEPAGSPEGAGGERPVRVGGRPDSEGGGGLNFDALLDDVAGEAASPTAPAAQEATAGPRDETARPATPPAAPKDSVEAAYDDLAAIFGEKQSREGEYERAKPLLERVITPLLQKGMSLAAAFKEMVRVVAQRVGQTVQQIAARMRETLVRFGREVEGGVVKIEGYQVKVTPPTPAPRPRETAETKYQVAYVPSSGSSPVGTLAPVNMASAMQAALADLERVAAAHGGIDAYVAHELGYDPAKIGDYFSAEQIDAIALAIRNVSARSGFVIGDQTGIGKGRVVAAMIRWSVRNGYIPIFITEKPNLYADMLRDLSDIDSGSFSPWITNSDMRGDDAVVFEGRTIETEAGSRWRARMREITDTGRLPDGYQGVFTTYDQMRMKNGLPNDRTAMLGALAPRSIMILDESHNAGGAGDKITIDKKTGRPKQTVAQYMRRMVASSAGALYSSATWAKRPDVMDLYNRTDLRLAAASPQDLRSAFEHGGVPLQQIAAAMLARAGQYVRRERSFDGVEFAAQPVTVDKASAEEISRAMALIADLDPIMEAIVEVIDNDVKNSGQGAGQSNAVGNPGAASISFSSLMHNIVDQSLLALSAEPVAQEAIAKAKAGEKVVIAVANTMGSMIGEYAEANEIRPGQPIDIKFNDLLLRYLDRIRYVSVTRPFQRAAQPMYVTDEMMGPRNAKLFADAKAAIEAMRIDIPLSPIDLIARRLRQAGLTVGEITGRQNTLDVSEEGAAPIYKLRTERERSKAQVNRTVKSFQDGEIDVVIINRSGATGLSMHADGRRAKDLRPRRMIIAQPEKNVDTFMQMLGRVHRTGQVTLPRYSLMIADVPSVIRPAAVLMKKMRSLNANTTASAKSHITDIDVPDFFNEYGDKIAAQLMNEEPDLWRRLRQPNLKQGKAGFDPDNAMAKVTGRIPLLPLAEQEAIYDRLQSEYQGFLEQVEQMGLNALEAKTLELDAKTLETVPFLAGTPGVTSPFAAPAAFTRVDMKSLYRPPAGERVRADVAKAVSEEPGASADQLRRAGTDQARRMSDELQVKVRAYTAEVVGEDPDEAARNREASIEDMHRRVSHLLATVPAGSPVLLQTDEGNLYGVVIKVARRGKAKNPAAPGAWRWTVQTSQYRAEIPGSQLYGPDHHDRGHDIPGAILIEPVNAAQLPGDVTDVYALFDKMQGGGREKRWIITGNVFAGYVQERRGRIINYTDADGALHAGVLMARDFNAREVAEATPVKLPTPELAIELMRTRPDVVLQTTDRVMEVQLDGAEWTFSVPKARGTGGRYFLNDDMLRAAFPAEFIGSRGNPRMTLKVDGEHGSAVLLAALRSNDVGLEAAKNRDAAREFLRTKGVASEASSERESREPHLTLKPEVRAKADLAALRVELDRLNLRDVQLVERAGKGGAVGGFIDGLTPLIWIAMGRARDPLGTLHHEALHAIKALGLFTRQEWNVLENMARQKWMRQFKIAERYPDLSAQAQLEEAISDGLRYAAANQAKGVVARAIALIKKLVEATRNWMRGMGFTSSADVFNEVMSGRAGARQRLDRRGIAQQERFALNPQTEARIDRVVKSGEPQPLRQRLYDLWNSIRQANLTTLHDAHIDGLGALERAERGITGGRLMDALVSPYKKAMAARNLHAFMRTAMQDGPLTYDPATGQMGYNRAIGGLTSILSPLNTPERLKAFIGYSIGLRAERLMAEGRENLMTATEIQEFKDLANQPEFADFPQIHAKWIEFNSAMLDYAEAAGIINPERRAQWENNDYVPFYRILQHGGVGGPSKGGVKPGDPWSVVKRLEGGQEQINDLLENMVRNTAHLIGSGLNNIARQAEVRMLAPIGALQRERMDWRLALIPTKEAVRRLQAAGIAVPGGKIPNGLLQMFAMMQPTDPDVISVMIDGKPQFYRVLDPALLASLRGFDHAALGAIARAMQAGTALLRKGVTTDPGFMARNFVRDSMAAWALSGENLTPFVSSVRGAISYFTKPELVAEMRAQGVSAGWYSRSPENLAAMIRRDIEGTTSSSSLLLRGKHAAQRAWEMYQALGEASEMANRIAVYEAAQKRGASKAEAAYAARDVLNFWRSGHSEFARGLIWAYPFWNARLQGLDKMYRAFKQDPVRGTIYAGARISTFVAGRALLLSFAAMVLAWFNKDEERFKELPEHDKNNYSHIFLPRAFKDWIGIDHITMPKPFELGVLFMSIPERIYTAAYEDGSDFGGREWRNAAKQIGHMITDQLSLSVIPNPMRSFQDNIVGMAPQLIKPAAEVAANRASFLQRPIENRAMEGVRPEDRSDPWTSSTAGAIAKGVPGLSPAQVDHLIRGYFGTMGTYAVWAADALGDLVSDGPVKPSTPIDRRPVIGSFVRGDSPRNTKYVNELYAMREDVRQLVGSLNKLEAEDPKAAAALAKKENVEAYLGRSERTGKLQSSGKLEAAAREVGSISKAIRAVYTDRTITDPAKKRQLVDDLVRRRNQVARDAGVTIREIDRARRGAAPP